MNNDQGRSFYQPKAHSVVPDSQVTRSVWTTGAVQEYVVSDNLKTAVTQHIKDGLVIYSAYQEKENFYNVVVLPNDGRILSTGVAWEA